MTAASIEGFTLLRNEHIDELNTQASLYRHDRTGAQILSMSNDDTNKVFSINFRTPPEDSTGVAHILEHSVLCGSKKYPLKEPFVELIKSSVNTFLNAMTYPDKTVYPVASQNLQDFYNLVDVYLDAVLNPILAPHTFEQEGWHYELNDPEDPLQFKGVVFNEMKGAFSSPDRQLATAIQHAIFPDTTYGVSSGGDPKVIPDLTYEYFKNFHETYYHPSNSLIFFYGDDDPAQRLKLLASYLDAFEAREISSDIPHQTHFDEPRRVVKTYASDDDDPTSKRSMAAVSWLLPDFESSTEELAWHVLSHALGGTSASILRKTLLDSGLGERVTGGGVSTGLLQPTFGVGIKNVARDDVDAVETLILKTLEDIVENGLDEDAISAAINTTEFSMRENNTGSYPRGLVIGLGALDNWLYGRDPFEQLRFEKPLAELKERIAQDPSYLTGLIAKHILPNTHRATVILHPDSGKAAQDEAAERARLDEVRASLSDDELQNIVNRTKELRALQSKTDPPELLQTLPSLSIDDLDRTIQTIPKETTQLSSAPALYHDLFTNGILYLDLAFDLSAVPEDLIPLLPLFGRALLGHGTNTQDYVSLSQRIGRETGGIWTTRLISETEDQSTAAKFIVRSKAMVDQTDKLLDLLQDIFLNVKLDNPQRFGQMLLESKASHEARLVPSGHGIVGSRLDARFSLSGYLSEKLGGVDQLFFLRGLADGFEDSWPETLSKLETLRDLILRRNALTLNVTLDRDNWNSIQPALAQFVDTLPEHNAPNQTWTRPETSQDEALTIPAQVNYVGKAANIYDLGYTLHGSISVIRSFIGTSYLWEKIRVQGGAYGAFTTFDRYSGTFGFLSYRDPNVSSTLEHYDRTAEWLQNTNLSKLELERAIISTIGRVDSYQLPDAKGYTSMVRHFLHINDETRQAYRDEIFATSNEHFHALGQALAQVQDKGQVVVLGSKDAIQNANPDNPNWLQETSVL